METKNPHCTIQLRNIVYIHNQLVKYGAEHIYVKGWAVKEKYDKKDGSFTEDNSQLNPPS